MLYLSTMLVILHIPSKHLKITPHIPKKKSQEKKTNSMQLQPCDGQPVHQLNHPLAGSNRIETEGVQL